jgi:hypothetical protein
MVLELLTPPSSSYRLGSYFLKDKISTAWEFRQAASRNMLIIHR